MIFKYYGNTLNSPHSISALQLQIIVFILFLIIFPVRGHTMEDTPAANPDPLYLNPGDYPDDPLAKRIGRIPYMGFFHIDPTTAMEFVWVKGGCYKMGDTFGDGDKNEKPVHEVCVDGFYIGKYEVTVGQYRRYLQASNTTSGVDWDDDDCPLKRTNRYSLSQNKFGDDEHKPMVKVSWHGATSMAKWLRQKTGRKYRLPTEAEWEHAARSGGRREKYSGGNTADAVAWYKNNSNGRTHLVGTKAPNGLGLYDMSGNVWEWCSDWYDTNYYSKSPRNTPEGPSSGSYRVVRGGGWSEVPEYVRSAYRYGIRPGYAINDLGFRLVLAEGSR